MDIDYLYSKKIGLYKTSFNSNGSILFQNAGCLFLAKLNMMICISPFMSLNLHVIENESVAMMVVYYRDQSPH